MRQRRPIVLSLAIVLLLAGCAGRAWKQAQREDTVAAYHYFLKDHGESRYAEDARAHLAYARVRDKPSREAFHRFEQEHPGSPLIARLRPHVEEFFFQGARATGTAAAYREFLQDFAGGALAARAEGNAVYLENHGFGSDLAALAAFAQKYPQSDYAAEALRSIAGVDERSSSAFRRVGLVLDVPASVPGADRLRRVFAERAAKAYAGTGVGLVSMRDGKDPRLADMGARLEIAHRETPVSTELEGGTISEPGILARTTVSLTLRGADEPFFRDSFEHRAAVSERREGVSVLFGAGTNPYWLSFFVPVATWDTACTAREPTRFSKPPVSVEVSGSRAIVVFGDGDFQFFDLGDPANPVLLGEYRRPRDLARFEGVRILGSDAAVYGPDGVEIVRLGVGGAQRLRVLGRDVVGSVVGVERIGDTLVVAGNRGLLAVGDDDSARTLLPREILGLSRMADRLLFTDGTSLYVAPLPLVAAGRVEGELRLGRGFRPAAIRVQGTSAVVLGERGTVWVDLRQPSQPRPRARIGTTEVGLVRDASVVDGRLFLLGGRGLLVADASGEHVVESVDVAARHRLRASGRHLVMVGEQSLQVVDATPFLAGVSGAAAAAR